MPCLGSVPWSVHTKQSKALAESARDQPPRNPIKFNPLVNVNPRTHQSETASDRKIAGQSAEGSDPGGSLDLPQGLALALLAMGIDLASGSQGWELVAESPSAISSGHAEVRYSQLKPRAACPKGPAAPLGAAGQGPEPAPRLAVGS